MKTNLNIDVSNKDRPLLGEIQIMAKSDNDSLT